MDNGVSFDKVFEIRERIFRVKEEEQANAADIPIVLVGNKCDVSEDQRQVSLDRGRGVAGEWGIPFFEVSALKEIQNEECFFELAREMKVPITLKCSF